MQSMADMTSLIDHIYNRGYLGGELSDVKIVAFGREYKLHKLILDRSPYFRTLFSHQWDADGCPTHNLDFSIDHNITETAFEQCLQRLYGGAEDASEILGYPEKISAAFQLFATANFLNLADLVEFCLVLIINSLTKYTVAETLCFAMENHYPQSDSIIDSCKSFLCAEGSEMTYIEWTSIPVPIIVEVVSSDGFYIQSEWERCMWVVGFLTEEDYPGVINTNDLVAEAEIDEQSDSSSNFDIGLEKLSVNADINLSTPVGSYTELNRLGMESNESPEKGDDKAKGPEEGGDDASFVSADSETDRQLLELTRSIHYCHLTLLQLQHLEKIKDKHGKPLFDKAMLQDGLWQQMKLKHLVLGARDERLDVCESHKHLMDLGASGDMSQRFFPVPSHDKSVAGRRTSDPATAAEYYAGRTDPSAPLGTSDPDAQMTFSPFPPFRFSVKFDDISQLKGENKIYTDSAIWYAGTYWSVYLQKITNKKSSQLGVYLHREARSQRDLTAGANNTYTLLSGKSTAKSSVGMDDTAMELKTEPRLVSFPTSELPPDYTDERVLLMSYFEIYTPSKRGKNLTCFSSSPSGFSCGQSWGWRSSSLYHFAEESAKQNTQASLKFMVVIGVV